MKRPFIRGVTLPRGLTITMVINHLQVLGWSYKYLLPPGSVHTLIHPDTYPDTASVSSYSQMRRILGCPITETKRIGHLGSMKPFSGSVIGSLGYTKVLPLESWVGVNSNKFAMFVVRQNPSDLSGKRTKLWAVFPSERVIPSHIPKT